jgi:Icc-related predicted phosphoesterase
MQTESPRTKMAWVGSRAVRDIVLEARSVLDLQRHVRESRAAQRVGRMLCLNPGSKYTAGALGWTVGTFTSPSTESIDD